MKYALVDGGNVVRNIIVYAPESSYSPPAGHTIRRVEDWIDIGQDADTPEPTD